MVFIHGGGFFSGSSSYYLGVLNDWSIRFKVPIFCIDYRLAPITRYPEVPNDVIRSYVWIVNFVTKVLKADLKRVVVTGDSAGGNLAFVIANWCIANSFRKPDHLHVYYPATYLDRRRFSPSMSYTLDDYILNYAFLRMCIEFYLPQDASSVDLHDPCLNPVFTPEAVLRQYPPVDLMLMERDPLSDDGFRMADRLLSCNVACRVYYCRHMPHGILNFAMKHGMHSALLLEASLRPRLTEILGRP